MSPRPPRCSATPGAGLLEREHAWRQITAAFDAAAEGTGRDVIVLGEAGAGKTALVRALTGQLCGRADVFVGACEALFSPRPLGPLVDLASALPPALAAQVRAGGSHYNGLFPSFVAFLRERTRPAVLVLEDLHWADAATLDFLRFVARRIGGTRALLIATARNDELALDHPLRRVLGDLQGAGTSRLELAPLSREAVGRWARRAGRDAEVVYGLAGGNPFYVEELLAADPNTVPASVRDAVLARVARLSPTAQQLVALVAIEPGRLEREVADALMSDSASAVNDAVAAGVLHAGVATLAFRHEIARRSVEDALPADQRSALHALVLGALRQRPGERDPAREVHHALGAGRFTEVLPLARRAAEQAAAVGAHREAATLYRRALEADHGHDRAARATLLEAAADELHKAGVIADAIELRTQALALRRATGDRAGEGTNLRVLGVLARLHAGDHDAYRRHVDDAIAALEPLGPGAELAKAYACRSHVHALASAFDAAVEWGQRAVQMAQAGNDVAARVLAATRHGAARLALHDDAQARAQLEQALALAIDARLEDQAADIHLILQSACAVHRDLEAALDITRRGIAYGEARDLDGHVLTLRFRSGHLLVDKGRWDDGEHAFAACAGSLGATPFQRRCAEYALRLQQARRGAPPAAAATLPAFADECRGNRAGGHDDGRGYWCRTQEALHETHVGYRPASVATACTEAAWLRGDATAAIDVATRGLAIARETGDGRLAGPLLVWLARLGAPQPHRSDAGLLHVSALELDGDREAAAAGWERLAEPYERALVLAFGSADQMRRAVMVFDTLGAARAAAMTRTRMRAAGLRGVERGPYRHARDDAFGFTRREREVADLLREGLSNAVIAQRLHRSPRTVEKHVAGVLAKLDVPARAQALAKLSSPGGDVDHGDDRAKSG